MERLLCGASWKEWGLIMTFIELLHQPSIIIAMFQIIVLTSLLIRTVALIRINSRSMMPVFLSFGLISFLMSDLYWVAYVMIRLDTRMPFAANEFGEGAAILLFSAVLTSTFQYPYSSCIKETIFAVCFAAINAGLWIAWSGEWVDDIMTGVIFGYYILSCVRSLKRTEALSKKEWRLLALAGTALAGMQILIFFIPPAYKIKLDICCYIVMFAGIGWFVIRVVRALRSDTDFDQGICLSFAACG